MTDDYVTDTLAWLRANSGDQMGKAEREEYLRSHGWRRISNTSRGQRWQHRSSGITATLSGACRLQILADMERPT